MQNNEDILYKQAQERKALPRWKQVYLAVHNPLKGQNNNITDSDIQHLKERLYGKFVNRA